MSRKIAILGAGGHAQEIYDIVKSSASEYVYFVDENILEAKTLFGCPVYKQVQVETDIILCGVGNPSLKKYFDERYKNISGWLHKKAWLGPGCLVENTTIGANTVITANVTVKQLTSINSNCVISHGCTIGKYCHISAGTILAGDVILGDEVYIGIGAKILPKVRIAKGAVIGAGAVITKNVPEKAVMIGVPGKIDRILKENENFTL